MSHWKWACRGEDSNFQILGLIETVGQLNLTSSGNPAIELHHYTLLIPRAMLDWGTPGLALETSEDGESSSFNCPFLQLCCLCLPCLYLQSCWLLSSFLQRLRAQHLHLAHHKVLTACVIALSKLPGWLSSAGRFNSSFKRKKHTLILLFLFRSPLWPE